MKKVILLTITIFTMYSFTIKEDVNQKEKIASPECYKYANNKATLLKAAWPKMSYEDEFNYFSGFYNDCNIRYYFYEQPFLL